MIVFGRGKGRSFIRMYGTEILHDYNAITSSSIPCHNLLFRRCQSLLGRNGTTRALKEPRLANWGGAGGEPGASGVGGVGGRLLPFFPLNFKERRMNMPATKINKRRITFRLMLRRWYPVATVSSLSAAFTSTAIRSTL